MGSRVALISLFGILNAVFMIPDTGSSGQCCPAETNSVWKLLQVLRVLQIVYKYLELVDWRKVINKEVRTSTRRTSLSFSPNTALNIITSLLSIVLRYFSSVL